jgi:arylsulfatase A-like enzyme
MRDETIIIFGSDNGFFFGEHRYGLKKGVSYEPALRIPMMIKVPPAYNATGKSPPAKVHSITGQIDLAPTILDYAGAPRGSCRTKRDCRIMDGRSLRALLGDRPRPDVARLGRSSFSGRGMLIERVKPCYWPALRTPRTYYSLYPWNNQNTKPDCGKLRGQEVYDLERDPEQKNNAAKRKAWAKKIRKRLLPRLIELRDCGGVERRDPRHRDRSFCE